MGRNLTIICDQCSRDITTTGNCEDYRLALRAESKTPWYEAEGLSCGAVTAMAISPPLDRDYYFCGRDCLLAWAAAQIAADDAWRNRPAAVWEREHEGHIISSMVMAPGEPEHRHCHTCKVNQTFPAHLAPAGA